MSARKFEQKVGLTNGYVASMTERSRFDYIDKIFETFPELSRSWLLRGEGEMLNDRAELLNPKLSDGTSTDAMIKLLAMTVEENREQRKQVDKLINALMNNITETHVTLVNDLLDVYDHILETVPNGKPVDAEILKRAYDRASKALDSAVINNESTKIIETVRDALLRLIGEYTE